MSSDSAITLASAELSQLRGPLAPEDWNRLYWRCVYAMRRLPERSRRPVQIAWELVMERRTGTRVFFMPDRRAGDSRNVPTDAQLSALADELAQGPAVSP